MFPLIFQTYSLSQIATASGPCGKNRNYLFNLEKAMFDIGELLLLFFSGSCSNE